MKQVIQDRRGGRIEVREVPAPGARPGFVVVRTAASLISTGTERAMVELGRRSLLGKALERPDLVRKVVETARTRGLREAVRAVAARLDEPGLLGYSCAGTVVEVGPGVGDASPGDRVACGGFGYAVHAEVVAVPRNLVVPVPASVSFDEAAFVAVGAIALHGVRTAEPEVGDTVAVIGLGLVGLLAAQILKAAGCRVVGVDPLPGRRDLAGSLGADVVVEPGPGVVERVLAETGGRGADAVLVCAATRSSDPVRLAGELARDRARVSIVGDVGLEIPRSLYYAKELELRISRSYGPGRYDPRFEEEGQDYPVGYVPWTERRNMAEFLRLVADRRVRVAELVSARYPVERAAEAYGRLTERSDAPPVAVLLTYGHSSPTAERFRVVPIAPRARTGAPAVSVIGAGTFARSVLLPRLRERKVGLRVVVNARSASAEAAARRFGFARAATDPAAAFGDPETEAVVIATRHDTHARLAIEALGAGKHVFVEKPMALTREELEAVREAAATAGRVFLVGYNRRFAPLARRLRAEVAGWGSPFAVVYRVNAGPVPADHWTRDPRVGGGRIVGEACHFVDFIQYVTDADPIEVIAYAVPSRDGGSPDTVTFQMRMADGSVASVHYFALGDRGLPKERIEVFGSGGAAVLDDFRRLEIYRAGRRRVVRVRGQDKGHTGELDAFLDAITGRSAPPISLESLVRTTAVTFAVEESLRTGRPAPVGP